jgi:hypothetical protein
MLKRLFDGLHLISEEDSHTCYHVENIPWEQDIEELLTLGRERRRSNTRTPITIPRCIAIFLLNIPSARCDMRP